MPIVPAGVHYSIISGDIFRVSFCSSFLDLKSVSICPQGNAGARHSATDACKYACICNLSGFYSEFSKDFQDSILGIVFFKTEFRVLVEFSPQPDNPGSE
ncbi:hypothetical protein SDC9_147023 [bioreactor metagenome]|uniref:Uncharacterized protein n=1 Tax=bioreactor metagenome TaxID=1076179 RepID=A0A645EFE0_9ZZZZ